MGWLWTSPTRDAEDEAKTSTSSPSSNAPSTPAVGLTEEQRLRIFGRPDSLSGVSQPTDPQRQPADKDIEAFLSSFESSTSPSKTTASTTAATSQPAATTSSQQPPSERLLPDGSVDISPSAMLPRTMSCRQAFDQAFYCQSLGGKFNDIYRFGKLQPCSEQWGAFWFCMRTRTFPGKEKEEQIAEYYRDREERWKKQWGSSEDVWEIREKGVERAFWRDPDGEGEGDGGERHEVRE